MAKSDKTYAELKAEIDDIENKVLKLMETSERTSSGDIQDILDFNAEYLAIIKELEKTTGKMLKYDKARTCDLWDKTDSLYDDINYIYDASSIPINNIIASKTLELEDSYRKSQGLQLAVFSIVLSILAFVLTNAKILGAEGINFKNVLLVNLSFILCTDVLFLLIYLFIGPIFYSKKGKLRIFTFVILPIILVVALVLISVFMK